MSSIVIRTMREDDVAEADRIFRVAFGTFLGLPDPSTFAGDADYVRSRSAAWPEAALVAERDGEVVGSILSVRRGSFAFFGPLTIRPDLWEGGIAKQLVDATVAIYDRWQLRHSGLFTFADSAKHVALYGKFGFWPHALMALMARPVTRGGERDDHGEAAVASVSVAPSLGTLPDAERAAAIAACRRVTDALYAGLDATDEIDMVRRLGLGDTALVRDGDDLVAFAVCHVGAGSEAGSGACLVKFAAVRPDVASETTFDRLLEACDALAMARGAGVLLVGVDLGTRAAYQQLLARGFRTQMQGVALHRHDDVGYLVRDALVLGDWR
jgi:predicted N-acetyltransferase YhbS